MGLIVSVSNQKGGVGKTTTCVNVSAYLASKGYKVLLVDLDQQGNATSGLGYAKNELSASVREVLIEEMPVESVTLKTQIENLDLLPSSIHVAGAEVELVYVKGREKVLKEALNKVRNNYDYILIDCPPSLGLLTINALVAADKVIIPIQSEYYALEGVSQLMHTISLVKKHTNPSLEIDGVVLTMNDNRALISKQISSEIRKFFGKKVYDTVIPRNIRLSEAPSHGCPIIIHDPKCAGARAYNSLTEEFLAKNPKPKRVKY